MNSIRLLPIVIFATFSLLVFKAIDLVAQGPAIVGGVQAVLAANDASGSAAEGADAGSAPTAPELSPAAEAAAQRAAGQLFPEGKTEEANPNAPRDAVPTSENKTGGTVPLASDDGTGMTEKAVLQRLSERRAELDTLAKDLDMRANLVAAAEKRLAERIASLEALETRINALVDEKKSQDAQQFASVVAMYETMKAKDAAAIFDGLDMAVLSRVAKQMNPRKLGPILAAMNSERARDLTMRLSSAEAEPVMDAPLEDLSSLPQIVGK